MVTGEFREGVDRAIALGDASGAAKMLASAWELEPGSALAGFVSSRYDRIAGRLGLLPQRWAILRSFTVEPIVPLLKAGAYAGGIALQTHLGEFNAYAQEILDPGSALYRFACAEDHRPVEPIRERKSVGKESTFERDLVDRARMEEIIEHLARQVEQRLADLGLRGRTLTLKVKWSNFQLVTRSVSSPHGFQDAQTMTPVLHTLLRQLDGRRRPVRLLGVAVSHFLSQEEMRRIEQVVALSLWDVE